LKADTSVITQASEAKICAPLPSSTAYPPRNVLNVPTNLPCKQIYETFGKGKFLTRQHQQHLCSKYLDGGFVGRKFDMLCSLISRLVSKQGSRSVLRITKRSSSRLRLASEHLASAISRSQPWLVQYLECLGKRVSHRESQETPNDQSRTSEELAPVERQRGTNICQKICHSKQM
jgi:hypothetical protein